MGYAAQPFAVDLNKARQALGSNDSALYEKVRSAALYDNYADQAEDCDFDQILRELIFDYGKPKERKPIPGTFGLFYKKQKEGLNPDLAHQYGYAMLVICDALGTFLTPQGDVFYAGHVWKEANELLQSKGISPDLDRMWQTQKLFNIPGIQGWPVISHYSKEEVAYLLSELKKLNIGESKPGEEVEELHELLNAFRDGLQVCKDKDVEWVSFLH